MSSSLDGVLQGDSKPLNAGNVDDIADARSNWVENTTEDEPSSSQYVTTNEGDDADDNAEEGSDLDDRFQDAKAFLDDENNDDEIGNDDGIDDNSQNDHSENLDSVDGNSNQGPLKGKKKSGNRNNERGIIYLSTIPTAMDLQQIRIAFSKFGSLGRVYLQTDHNPSKKRAKRTYFSEGWIEFKKKSEAKQTAQLLNCTQVGGKKRHPWFSDTWNIKVG